MSFPRRAFLAVMGAAGIAVSPLAAAAKPRPAGDVYSDTYSNTY